MNGKVLLVIVAVLMACVFMFGIAGNLVAPDKIDPEKESIEMVQPCGWVWCAEYDAQYAEHVNLPNSESNRNNAEANVLNAEATQVVSETWQQDTKVFGEGTFVGALVGGFITIVATVIAILVIGAIVGAKSIS